MKKRTTAFLVVTIIVMSVMMSPSAHAIEDKIHYYTYQNGDTVAYYLDENNTPYIFGEQFEKIYICLPLECLKETDTKILNELNDSIKNYNKSKPTKSPPTSYFNLSATSPSSNSIAYTRVVSYQNVTSVPTATLKLYPAHTALRVKSTNLYKESIFSGERLDLVYHYYCAATDSWYVLHMNNVLCTLSAGFGFQHSPSIYEYGRFDINKGTSGIISFDLKIWSTYTW